MTPAFSLLADYFAGICARQKPEVATATESAGKISVQQFKISEQQDLQELAESQPGGVRAFATC